MKLALITVHSEKLSEWVYPNLGLGYLASYIKRYSDVNVKIIDGARGEDVLRELRREKPDLIGITSTTLEFDEAEKLGMAIKSQYTIPVILGGVHISALPHTLPRCFDIGVIGEGEQTLLELVNLYSKKTNFSREDLKKIKGICFHQRKGVVITEKRGFIKPLDIIPYPSRDLFKMKKYYLKKQSHFPGAFGRGTSMITSRGCPYRCSFCYSCRFWEIVRFHSPQYVVGEIKHLFEKYRVRYVNIFDDIFNLSKQRVKKIVSLIKEEKINEKITFGIQCRANLIDTEMCKLLKEMGVSYLGFGLETGSEKILHFLKKGTVTVEDNRRAVKLAKQFGFKVGSGFMIGNPSETVEDLELTHKFIIENPLDVAGVYITTPLPGTELWAYAEKIGLVSDRMEWSKINQFFYGDNVILNREIDREQFLVMYSKLLHACHDKRRVLQNMLTAIRNNPQALPWILRRIPCHLRELIEETF